MRSIQVIFLFCFHGILMAMFNFFHNPVKLISRYQVDIRSFIPTPLDIKVALLHKVNLLL